MPSDRDSCRCLLFCRAASGDHFQPAQNNTCMFVLIAAFTVCFVTVLMSPTAARAQDEAAIVRKMFKDCVASGGIANTNYNAWVKQNGCICPPSTVGSGQVTCPSPSGNTSSSASTAASPMVTLLQTYQKALDQARAQEQAARNAATAYNDRVAAGASQDSEMKEDSAQSDDLASYKARKANEALASQNAFANAHSSASAFLSQSVANSSDSSAASPAVQKAWKQLHCLAYVSRIAFEDLALNDITNFHDVAAESSKGFDGASMDVTCPAAPLPNYGKQDMDNVRNKLKSDLDQANKIAQHLEQYHLPKATLPPVPPDVAADPQLAAAWKVQKALNAVDAQPNPGKTQEEFIQIQKDRDTIKNSLMDSNNAAGGKFSSIQVDLSGAGASAGSQGSSSTQSPDQP